MKIRATRWNPEFHLRLVTLLVGLAVAAIAGSLFAVWVQSSGDWQTGVPWERALMLHLHVQLPPMLDKVMLVTPWLGTGYTLFPLVIAAGVWLARRCRGDLALRLLLVQTGALTLNRIPKMLFERDRPNLWPRRGQYQWAAYPSGHIIAAISVLFTIAYLLHRERGWRWPYVAAAVVTIIIAVSRVYLGVHWPTDVLGGALMGVVWLFATMLAFPMTPIDRREGA